MSLITEWRVSSSRSSRMWTVQCWVQTCNLTRLWLQSSVVTINPTPSSTWIQRKWLWWATPVERPRCYPSQVNPQTALFSPRCKGAFQFPCFCISGPHLRFTDEVEALQVQVNKLETLGYNKIIALGHSGFDVDQQIAKRVRGVDVVIGGHTNTFLYTGI